MFKNKYLFYAIVSDCAGNTVSNKSASAPLEVTTGKQLVTSVSMSSSTASVVLGETTTIRATVGPADAYNKNVNWTFDSGASNLTLSSTTTISGANLTITGKVAGTAVLRATAEDGSGKSATCTVTIKPKTMVFAYTGAVQTTTLQPGTYTFECWGAQGGSYDSTYVGGKGGYATGTITLTSSTKLYIYVGGQGSRITGGFNGGGKGGLSYFSDSYHASGGGGASDIRIGTDTMNNRIIVAAGGGGAAGERSDVSATYPPSSGGHAGEPGNVTTAASAFIRPPSGGSFNGGGAGGTCTMLTGSAPGRYDASAPGGGGGGGFYGGGGGSGGGCSSKVDEVYNFTHGISGTNGSFGYGGNGGNGSEVLYVSNNTIGAGGAGGSSFVYSSGTASYVSAIQATLGNKYLTSTNTSAGSSSFHTTDGNGIETGHSGNGYVKITTLK